MVAGKSGVAQSSSAPRGLSTDEARRRLERTGPNALPAHPPEPWWQPWRRQFQSPLIYILLAALGVDLVASLVAAHGVPIDAVTIAAILCLNAALGVWQERRARDALAHLRALAAPHVWVLRDDRLERIPAQDVVPGDAVWLNAGDRVPADVRVTRTARLAVDESILTGESLPVEKGPDDEAFSGTLVVAGTGYAEVTRTGSESALGRLATLLQTVEAETTPLIRRLNAFGARVARWILALVVVLAVVGILAEGISHAGPALLLAVALAVAAVPEALPAVMTITLALGVERMARRRAVVRTLSAVEALGSVTVIVTDKTGTLTENRLEVRALDTTDPARAIRAIWLANDADAATGAGDPLDLALRAYVTSDGPEPAPAERISSRPFEARTRSMRVTCREGDEIVSYVKGAPEMLLPHCDLDPSKHRAWTAKVGDYAREGYRLVGLAWGPGETESHLTWLGVALLWDPPRARVSEAIGRVRDAGVRVLLATGDHPGTAAVVAETIGLPVVPDDVITGSELETMTDEALVDHARHATVFARVTPEHKLRLITALQRAGEIVAMTGDGVNDAPALKRADVGVAMGERGSDVAREASDVVLLDDNFETIVAAIEEGRSIYENLVKVVRYLFATNLAEVITVAGGAAIALGARLLGTPAAAVLPLTAAQLLWINLVTDSAPALALGLDRNPGVMHRRPRDPSAPLLDRGSGTFIVAVGATLGVLALGLFTLLTPLFGIPVVEVVAAVFLFLALAQLTITYAARRSDAVPLPNAWLHGTVVATAGLQMAVVFVPFTKSVLTLPTVSLTTWAAVVSSVCVSALVARGIGRAVRWRR